MKKLLMLISITIAGQSCSAIQGLMEGLQKDLSGKKTNVTTREVTTVGCDRETGKCKEITETYRTTKKTKIVEK